MGTVRSLVETGDLDAAIDLWDEVMQYDDMDFHLDSSEEDPQHHQEHISQEWLVERDQLGSTSIQPAPNWNLTDVMKGIDNDVIKVCTLHTCTDIIAENDSTPSPHDNTTFLESTTTIKDTTSDIHHTADSTPDICHAHSLCDDTTSHLTESNVVRIFQHALNHPTPVAKSFCIHIDGGGASIRDEW